jgi:hypothetical protein
VEVASALVGKMPRRDMSNGILHTVQTKQIELSAEAGVCLAGELTPLEKTSCRRCRDRHRRGARQLAADRRSYFAQRRIVNGIMGAER